MERSCRVIYYSAAAPQEELYHRGSLPPHVEQSGTDTDRLRANVRALLDRDRGRFAEGEAHRVSWEQSLSVLTDPHLVFVAATRQTCLEKLDRYANESSTVVLLDLQPDAEGLAAVPRKRCDSKRCDSEGVLAVLRCLTSDTNATRYRKSIHPFALLASDGQDRDTRSTDSVRTKCLAAGALDVFHNPLAPQDMDRLFEHIVDATLPPARLLGAPMAQQLLDSIHDHSVPSIVDHRPDVQISVERKSVIESAVQTGAFAAQDFDMDELTYAALVIVENTLRHPDVAPYRLPRDRLVTLLLATRRQYKHEREVHYHNWRHAVDVTQSTYTFLRGAGALDPPDEGGASRQSNGLDGLLTPFDALALVVSAIGHDVGHPGVNNPFLVACKHPLAQTYNDKSVLENYHCAAYSQLLRRHWPSLSNAPGFRARMISTILATDMQRHFEYMSHLGDLTVKVKKREAEVADWSDNEQQHARELTLALLMKAADISNVARPFATSSKWAKVLMNEFARQGELEAELNMPTCLFGGPPNKSDLLAAAQSQKGFITLFAYPLFQGIAEIVPSMSTPCAELRNNLQAWEDRIADEQRKRDVASHLATSPPPPANRLTGVSGRHHHRSEPTMVPVEPAQDPSSPIHRTAHIALHTSPAKHAAHEIRRQLLRSEHVATDPLLPSASMPFPPAGTSRRESRDLALEHWPLNHPSDSPSPRSCADTGPHIRHCHPPSRRASKDESLTTILVTSGGSGGSGDSGDSGGSGASPARQASPAKPLPGAAQCPPISTATATAPATTKPLPARASVPSSLSHAPSAATTATTLPHSPSTQPSSPDDDGPDADTDAPCPALPPTTTTTTKTCPPRVAPAAQRRKPSDPAAAPAPPHAAPLHASRSRSRLRALRFWRKKRREEPGVATPSDDSIGSPEPDDQLPV